MKLPNDKIKHILIDILVVFIIPISLFYFYTTLGGTSGALFGAEQPGSELVGEGQKFLTKLNELQGLKLNTEVFESAVYQSLVDTTVLPPTEDKGRLHPFIPPQRSTPSTQTPATTKTKATTAVKNLNGLLKGQ